MKKKLSLFTEAVAKPRWLGYFGGWFWIVKVRLALVRALLWFLVFGCFSHFFQSFFAVDVEMVFLKHLLFHIIHKNNLMHFTKEITSIASILQKEKVWKLTSERSEAKIFGPYENTEILKKLEAFILTGSQCGAGSVNEDGEFLAPKKGLPWQCDETGWNLMVIAQNQIEGASELHCVTSHPIFFGIFVWHCLGQSYEA